MELTIIVPIYNETKRIHHLISCLRSYLSVGHFFSIKFLLVDDGSTDDTKENALKLIGDDAGISLIGYTENRGKGSAVLFGLNNVQTEYVGFMDADIATPLMHIDHVMNAFKQEKASFIIGNRRATTTIYSGIVRRLASKFFNQIAHLPLKRKYPDTQAGFKFYHKSFVQQLIQLSQVKDFSFDVEHLFVAELLGVKVYSYPIEDWSNGENSKVSVVKDGIKMFRSCLRLFMNRKSYYRMVSRIPAEKQSQRKPDSQAV